MHTFDEDPLNNNEPGLYACSLCKGQGPRPKAMAEAHLNMYPDIAEMMLLSKRNVLEDRACSKGPLLYMTGTPDARTLYKASLSVSQAPRAPQLPSLMCRRAYYYMDRVGRAPDTDGRQVLD